MSENKSFIRDGSFYCVQSFMVKDLKLKGLEKEIYAIIYGFSMTDNQYFTGSQQYLAEWTSSTTRGVRKALTALKEKGLLEERERITSKGKYIDYMAIDPRLEEQSSARGEEQSSAGVRNKVPQLEEQSSAGGAELSSDHNIDNNNIDYKIVKKERKKATAQSSYNEILDSMVTDPKLKEALIEFIKMRKLSKKPPTDHALELLIKKLYKLSSNPETQIAIVEQSILNNWQAFYRLKLDDKNKNGYSERGTSRDKQYSELEQRIINFGSRSE